MGNSLNLEQHQELLHKIREVMNVPGDYPLDQDIGMDSLNSISTIVNLEVTLGINFKNEDMVLSFFSTIEKIATLVVEKYNYQGS